VGIDRSFMRLYDLEDATAGIIQSNQQQQQPTQTPFSSGGLDTSGLKI
jgi:hypothetical protein